MAQIYNEALPYQHEAIADHADLVFTMGVLIHVPYDFLSQTFDQIFNLSNKYILTAEYFAPKEEMVNYRGCDEMLWRRDYGSYWLKYYPVDYIAHGFCWKPVSGLDNITWWLFKKKE